jgi:hypothetical protein
VVAGRAVVAARSGEPVAAGFPARISPAEDSVA